MNMNFGVRAHDFGTLPPEQLAEKISAKGFHSIQLALTKAIPGVPGKPGFLNPGLTGYVKDEFEKKDIRVAVVGCYIDPVNPDENIRKSEIERFREYIRYARNLGCNVVGTETGRYAGDDLEKNRSDEAFNIMVESAKTMTAEAEKCGVFACIEGVTVHTIYSPQRMKQLLDAVNSDYIQVILDPCNYIDETNYMKQDQIMKDAFELFGEKIIAVHCKDFIINDGKKQSVPAGKGLLNYELLFSLVKKYKPYSHLLIEEVADVETLDESKKVLSEIYDRV
jgi:sugar phosphate isomerase/epimerase